MLVYQNNLNHFDNLFVCICLSSSFAILHWKIQSAPKCRCRACLIYAALISIQSCSFDIWSKTVRCLLYIEDIDFSCTHTTMNNIQYTYVQTNSHVKIIFITNKCWSTACTCYCYTCVTNIFMRMWNNGNNLEIILQI